MIGDQTRDKLKGLLSPIGSGTSVPRPGLMHLLKRPAPAAWATGP